jgi:hypothetical protein
MRVFLLLCTGYNNNKLKDAVKKGGDTVYFGGLLGEAPVMAVYLVSYLT